MAGVGASTISGRWNQLHLTSAYLEKHGLSNGLEAMDALIATTAVTHRRVMATGNAKHFKVLQGLRIERHTDA